MNFYSMSHIFYLNLKSVLTFLSSLTLPVRIYFNKNIQNYSTIPTFTHNKLPFERVQCLCAFIYCKWVVCDSNDGLVDLITAKVCVHCAWHMVLHTKYLFIIIFIKFASRNLSTTHTKTNLIIHQSRKKSFCLHVFTLFIFFFSPVFCAYS